MKIKLTKLIWIILLLANYQLVFGDECGIEGGDGFRSNCIDNTWGSGCTQMDCSGTCGGSAVYQGYYSDLDGDGWGLGYKGMFCSHVDNDGNPTNSNAAANPAVSSYAANNSDIDDDCKCGSSNLNTSNDCYDDCDLCVGTGANSVAYNGENTTSNCDGSQWDSAKCTIMDCAGVCGGNAVIGAYYTTDADGDGLGVGSTTTFCSADALASYATSLDSDDDCDSNQYDECGTCSGKNAAGVQQTADGYVSNCVDNTWGSGCTQMDCSGTCINAITVGDTAKWQGYYTDADGDGYGVSFKGNFCSHVDNDGVPTDNDAMVNPSIASYAPNNLDLYDTIYCENNNHDYCGICDGINTNPNLGNCGENNEDCPQIDCNGDCFGSAEYDECDFCTGGNTNVADGELVDCSGACFEKIVGGEEWVSAGESEDCVKLMFLSNAAELISQFHFATGDKFWINTPANNLSTAEYYFKFYFNDLPNIIIMTKNDEFDCLNETYPPPSDMELLISYSIFQIQTTEDLCGNCGGDNSSCSGCTDSGACNYDDTTTLDDESCYYVQDGECDCAGNILDCAGDCGGSAEFDDCDLCNGNNTSCADCAGIANGPNLLDNCNFCDDNLANDCNQDCTGDWGGEAVIDECGICGGDNSTCLDCAGIPNGPNLEDNCETCNDSPDNDCT